MSQAAKWFAQKGREVIIVTDEYTPREDMASDYRQRVANMSDAERAIFGWTPEEVHEKVEAQIESDMKLQEYFDSAENVTEVFEGDRMHIKVCELLHQGYGVIAPTSRYGSPHSTARLFTGIRYRRGSDASNPNDLRVESFTQGEDGIQANLIDLRLLAPCGGLELQPWIVAVK